MSGNVEEWATYVFLDKPNASYMGGDRDKLKNGSAIPERGGTTGSDYGAVIIGIRLVLDPQKNEISGFSGVSYKCQFESKSLFFFVMQIYKKNLK